MSFFSKPKEISIYDLTDSLWDLFLVDYRTLAKGVNDLDEEKQEPFTDKQYLELMIVPISAVLFALTQKFGDTQEVSDIFNEIRIRFFERYFKDSKEKEFLEKLFWERYDEYSKIINKGFGDDKDQLGQSFRKNYFGEIKGMNDFRVMKRVSIGFFLSVKNITQFLNEISLK
jgi:hypothetical protein